MSNLNELHDKAMELTWFALRERRRGNDTVALPLFEQALELELAAIAALEEPVEPTYSLLHRSAATLALDCNDLRQAEKLAAKVLAQEAPYMIAMELHDVLEQVRFRRYLKDTGIYLQSGEIRLSLSGEAVGAGTIAAREISGRIQSIESLIYRTIERLAEMPFQKQTPEKVLDAFPIFVSAPSQEENFTISFSLGAPAGMLDVERVMGEIQELTDIVNKSGIAQLQERIPAPEYLRHFLAQAKKMAPDGRRIKRVGLTFRSGESCRSVVITRTAGEMPPLPENLPDSPAEYPE